MTHLPGRSFDLVAQVAGIERVDARGKRQLTRMSSNWPTAFASHTLYLSAFAIKLLDSPCKCCAATAARARICVPCILCELSVTTFAFSTQGAAHGIFCRASRSQFSGSPLATAFRSAYTLGCAMNGPVINRAQVAIDALVPHPPHARPHHRLYLNSRLEAPGGRLPFSAPVLPFLSSAVATVSILHRAVHQCGGGTYGRYEDDPGCQ